MAINKNGEMNWSDTVLFDPNKASTKKDEWMRLKNGSNIVRILTLPHQYYQHTFLPEGGKKYGYRVNCSKTYKTFVHYANKTINQSASGLLE